MTANTRSSGSRSNEKAPADRPAQVTSDDQPMELDPPDIGSSSAHLAAELADDEEVSQSEKEAELAELFLEMGGDEEMLEVATPVDSSIILASFESVLSDAKRTQKSLFAEKSKWLTKRKERLVYPDSPAKVRALEILEELLNKTTDKLAINNTRVEDAQRELDLFRKTLPIPQPTPTLQDEVVIDINQPYHAALERLYRFKTVPVHPGTCEVDFSRLQLKDLAGPELNLSAALKDTTASTLVYDTVNEVNEFMEQFLTHYQDKLREVFPRLVSHYMRQALKKSKLVKDYDLVIGRTPFEDRDWKVVSVAIDEILQLQTIRQEVKLMLFGFRANKDEDPITYCKRFRDLVRMAHAEDMGRHLSELIYQSLPTQGREFLDREYPDGVQKVEDYSSVLDLLSKMHSAFKGSRTQAGMHIAARWAPHAIAKGSGGNESSRSTKPLSAVALGKRPANSSLSRDSESKK
ncbi:hypothetical protein BGX23_004375, partial [Mortierella sp. AD031]